MVATTSHRFRVWHGWVLFGMTLACAPRQGWQRQEHACTPASPGRVCLAATPDRPIVLEVGGAKLVPGECAEPPKRSRGRIRVELRDPPHDRDVRWPAVAPGRATWLRLDAEGEVQRQRERCDATRGAATVPPGDE